MQFSFAAASSEASNLLLDFTLDLEILALLRSRAFWLALFSFNIWAGEKREGDGALTAIFSKRTSFDFA